LTSSSRRYWAALEYPFCISIHEGEIVGIIQQKHTEIFRSQFSFPVFAALSLLERLLVFFYRRNTIVVNSIRTKEDLRSIGYHEKNMHVIYPGLPDCIFQYENTGLRFRKPRVVCLTKFRRYKLIDNAIHAINEVRKTIPDCEMVIAGRTNDLDPEYENELHRLVSELELQK